MHWMIWLAAGLVVVSGVVWLAWELVPFALYPLVLAAALVVTWRIARRSRARRP